MGRGRIEPHRGRDLRTATRATGPVRRSPGSSVATTRAALFTILARGFAHRPGVPYAQADFRQLPRTIGHRLTSPLQQSLPTNRGFSRSALSEGPSSNRHCQLLEFAVTHRKQTTDTPSNRQLFTFVATRTPPAPVALVTNYESQITSHESREVTL